MFIPSFPRTMRPEPPHMAQLNISLDGLLEEPPSLSVIDLLPRCPAAKMYASRSGPSR